MRGCTKQERAVWKELKYRKLYIKKPYLNILAVKVKDVFNSPTIALTDAT